jgi:hypothetical protein
MIRRRMFTVSLAAVAITVAGCSSSEEPPAATSAPTAEDTADDTASETTDEAAETTDAAPGELDGDVPAFADIWEEVIANSSNAESLTADLSTNQGGEEITFYLSGQLDDSNFEIRANLPGQQVEMVMADGRMYLRGDQGFLESTGMPAPEAAAGTWIVLPEGMDIGDDFSLQGLWRDAFSDFQMPESTEVKESELTEVDGVEAYRYLVTDDGADVEVWVDAAELMLLKVEGSDGGEGVSMTFKDWNAVGPIATPEGATPIEELMGSGSGS